MARKRDRTESSVLGVLEHLLSPAPGDARDVYQRVAPSYDAFRELWVRLAGRGAEEAMIEDLRATLRPGYLVLDAGAGTGAMTRKVLQLQPDARVTMLDLAPAMLESAGNLPAEKVVGDLMALPFEADRFDVIVSAWAIETVPDPMRAASEWLRVLAPGGHVLYTFCSLPQGWLSRAGSVLLRRTIEGRFAGQALPGDHVPWHGCERSHWRRFAGGLTNEIALRKCCRVPISLAAAGSVPVASPTERPGRGRWSDS